MLEKSLGMRTRRMGEDVIKSKTVERKLLRGKSVRGEPMLGEDVSEEGHLYMRKTGNAA